MSNETSEPTIVEIAAEKEESDAEDSASEESKDELLARYKSLLKRAQTRADRTQKKYLASEKFVRKLLKTQAVLEKNVELLHDNVANLERTCELLTTSTNLQKETNANLKQAYNNTQRQVVHMRNLNLELTRGIRDGLPLRPWKQCEACDANFDKNNEMRAPRVLDCGHTICHKCALSKMGGNEITCPFDTLKTTLGRRSDDIGALPKNLMVFLE